MLAIVRLSVGRAGLVEVDMEAMVVVEVEVVAVEIEVATTTVGRNRGDMEAITMIIKVRYESTKRENISSAEKMFKKVMSTL